MSVANSEEEPVSITPLLKRLWPSPSKENVTASEIAGAISHIFTNSLTPVQTGALLTALHFTGFDRQPEVLSKCSLAMRNAAVQVDRTSLREVIRTRGRKEGQYRGGLVSALQLLSPLANPTDHPHHHSVRHRRHRRRLSQYL